jgi:ABC-type phosphate transport system substrate-binding protein
MKLSKYYFIVLVLIAAASTQAQVAVIANKSVSESSISSGKLNDIYSLRAKTWGNGKEIVPVTLKSENESVKKFFSAFGKSLMEMKKLWMKLQLTGEGQPPASVGSEDEVVSKVASTPGAIGFVSSDKVNSSVKVLLTIK